jgi:hypothetical protein
MIFRIRKRRYNTPQMIIAGGVNFLTKKIYDKSPSTNWRIVPSGSGKHTKVKSLVPGKVIGSDKN